MTLNITFATIATSAPMGQQAYEEQIIARAASALGGGSTVRRVVARSLRSDLPGSVRLPSWLMNGAPTSVRRAVGSVMYPHADVVHRMGFGMPPSRAPEVITIHDAIAWRFDDETEPEPFAAAELKRAAAVVAPSQFSADEVSEVLGLDHVHVIHNGVDEAYFDATPLSPAELTRLGIDGTYVLHAGGSSRRKNLEGLADAWQEVSTARPDLTLVLTGPPHPRRTGLFEALPRTRLLGRVDGGLVPRLMAGAAAVVVPSLYEGFGLPALEAMACRVPVVAARTSSLTEVVGDAGVLVEPNGAEIAEGLLWAASEASGIETLAARGRERARGFTWARSAESHAALWREVAHK